MVSGRLKHGKAPLAALRLLPRPRCYRQVAAVSPWVAIDPVLWADCASAWRGVQLALVALLALFGGSRSALAAQHSAVTEQPAMAQDRRSEAERESSPRPLVVEQKQWIRMAVARVLSLATFLFDWVKPWGAQIELERAHGPPSLRLISMSFHVSIRTTIPSAKIHSALTALSRSFPPIFSISLFCSAEAAHVDRGGCRTAPPVMRSTRSVLPFDFTIRRNCPCLLPNSAILF